MEVFKKSYYNSITNSKVVLATLRSTMSVSFIKPPSALTRMQQTSNYSDKNLKISFLMVLITKKSLPSFLTTLSKSLVLST